MACSLEDLKKTLEEVAPVDLSSLSDISLTIARSIPRNQDTKIDAGPFGNVTRLELRGKLRDYVDEAFKYSSFLFVLLRGPLLKKDYITSFADACEKYKFVITASNSNSYLNPAYYKTYNKNLVIEDAFNPNTGIQTKIEYQNAFRACIELFSTKQCPPRVLFEITDEMVHNLDITADLYSETYRFERGGRKAKKTSRNPKTPKRKTSKKSKRS